MTLTVNRTNPLRRYLSRTADPSSARRCLTAAAAYFGYRSHYDCRWESLTADEVRSLLRHADTLKITHADRTHLLEHIKGVVTQAVMIGAVKPARAADILLISAADCCTRSAPINRPKKEKCRETIHIAAAVHSGSARTMTPSAVSGSGRAAPTVRGKDRSALEPLLRLLGDSDGEFPWERLDEAFLRRSLSELAERGADRLVLSRILSTLDRLVPRAVAAGLIETEEAERMLAVTLPPDVKNDERRTQAYKSVADSLRRMNIHPSVIAKLTAKSYDGVRGTLGIPGKPPFVHVIKLKPEVRRRLQHWTDYWLDDPDGPLLPE